MRHETATTLVLDLVAQTMPLEVIVARTILDINPTARAATMAQIVSASLLDVAVVQAALDNWISAEGIVVLLNPNKQQGPVYWLQPLMTLKELGRDHKWVSKWAASQPKRQRNTLLQVRRRLQPRGGAPKR